MPQFMRRRNPYPSVRIPRRYGLAQSSSLIDVKARIERVTGKAIAIKKLPESTTGGCLGLLNRLEEVDLVYYSPTISQLHREQMLFHEFAHIIQDEEGWSEKLEGALPMSQDSVYAERIEYHAEAMADLIAAFVRRNNSAAHLGLAQRPLHEGLALWH